MGDEVTASRAEDERLRARIQELVSERDLAREECGHEKAMRASIYEELHVHIGLRLAAEKKLEQVREWHDHTGYFPAKDALSAILDGGAQG